MNRLWKFWIDYARRYRWWYLAGTLCLVATNYLTVSIPGFVQRAVDTLSKVGDGTGVYDPYDVVPWAWAILGAGVGIMIVRTLSRTFIFNPGRTIEFRLKTSIFERLLELPPWFFDRMRPGEIISRGTNDTSAVRSLVAFCTLQLFNVVFALTMTLAKMIWVDAELTGLCLLPMVVGTAVLGYAVKVMFRLFIQLQAQLATVSNRVLESYNSVAVLQTYNGIRGATARFAETNDALLRLGMGLVRVRSWLMPAVSVTGNLSIVILLYVGGRKVLDQTLTVGELAAFTVYVNIVVRSLTGMSWMIGVFQRGRVALQRVQEISEASTGRPEPTTTLPPAHPNGGAVEVRGLTFGYPQAETADDAPVILDDLSFRLEPGETLGVFGLTGTGKTTLLNLLARVYDPPAGSVLFDGVDVLDVPVRDYWRAVAYVPQEPYLFSRTIRENVALGEAQPSADTDARVQAAVADAALETDIDVFPEGLETRVGERGITVSGGQRQRIALARTFYRDFSLLLLDDVMSAVDHATESQLIDAIYRRGARASSIIVSHRISVLARADRVLVLDGGRIVDTGTHQTLVERTDGPYARAWRLQQAARELEREPMPVDAREKRGS